MDLGLTPDTRWRTDAASLVEAACAAGFTMLGTTSLLVTPEAPGLFARSGLGCHELLGLVVTRGRCHTWLGRRSWPNRRR